MTYEKLIHNIERLSIAKGVNKTTALVESGVGKNFIYNINKGSDPSIEKIQQLAAYFNVSTDYLLGNENDGSEGRGVLLAQDEQKLLTDYRSLNDLGKQEARKRVNELTNLEQYTTQYNGEGDDEYEIVPIAARGGDGKPLTLKKKKGKNLLDMPDYGSKRR